MQVLKSTAIKTYAGHLAYKGNALDTDDALFIGPTCQVTACSAHQCL